MVNTNIIIIVVVVVVVALVIFIVAVVIAVYCLCFRDSGNVGNSPHKRTFSFRSKHWTDSSGSHSMPREQQARKDVRDLCVCNLGYIILRALVGIATGNV